MRGVCVVVVRVDDTAGIDLANPVNETRREDKKSDARNTLIPSCVWTDSGGIA